MTANNEELYQCTACNWIGLYEEVTHIQFGDCDGVDRCPRCEFVETVMLYTGPSLHLCEQCGDHYCATGDDYCGGCNAADHDTLREQQADKALAEVARLHSQAEALAGALEELDRAIPAAAHHAGDGSSPDDFLVPYTRDEWAALVAATAKARAAVAAYRGQQP